MTTDTDSSGSLRQVLAALATLAREEELDAGWNELLKALADARVTLTVNQAAAAGAARAQQLIRGLSESRICDASTLGLAGDAVAAVEARATASRIRYVHLARHALAAAADDVYPNRFPVPAPDEPVAAGDPADQDSTSLSVPEALERYELHQVRALLPDGSGDWTRPGAAYARAAARSVQWADAVCLALAGELWAAGTVGMIGPARAADALGRMNPAKAAAVMDRMTAAAAAEILERMDPDRGAELLEMSDPDWVHAVLGSFETYEVVGRLLTRLDPVRAARVLCEGETDVAARVLDAMDRARAAEVLRQIEEADEFGAEYLRGLMCELQIAREADLSELE